MNGLGGTHKFFWVFTFHRPNESVYTSPVPEILCVKNVRAIVVFEFCKKNGQNMKEMGNRLGVAC